VGERVRKLRAVGDLSGPSWDKVNERAWKNYLWLLAAASLDGIFERPANQPSDLYSTPVLHHSAQWIDHKPFYTPSPVKPKQHQLLTEVGVKFLDSLDKGEISTTELRIVLKCERMEKTTWSRLVNHICDTTQQRLEVAGKHKEGLPLSLCATLPESWTRQGQTLIRLDAQHYGFTDEVA